MKKLTTFLENINYGWVDLAGDIHSKIDKFKFITDYRLLSPEKLSVQKIGICFDMVEYERQYLQNKNIEGKSILLVHLKDGKPLIHAFMIYQDNNQYYWIEYAFKKVRGIRSYQDLTTCLTDIKQEFLTENNITDIGQITFYNYSKPSYNIDQQTLINHCLNGIILNDEYSNLEF